MMPTRNAEQLDSIGHETRVTVFTVCSTQV